MPRPDRRLVGGEYDSPPDLAIIKFRGSDSPATRFPGQPGARPGSHVWAGRAALPARARHSGRPGLRKWFSVTAWLRISSYSSVGAACYGSPCQPGCCQCPYNCGVELTGTLLAGRHGRGRRRPGPWPASRTARDPPVVLLGTLSPNSWLKHLGRVGLAWQSGAAAGESGAEKLLLEPPAIPISRNGCPSKFEG